MDVKEEEILGPDISTHWYYVSKGRALRALLGSRHFEVILDVSAGSGVFSRLLLEAGVCRKATCVDPAYSDEHLERHNGHAISFRCSVARPTQDLILLMDVLEHVEDDIGLLRDYTRHLPAKRAHGDFGACLPMAVVGPRCVSRASSPLLARSARGRRRAGRVERPPQPVFLRRLVPLGGRHPNGSGLASEARRHCRGKLAAKALAAGEHDPDVDQ